MKKKLTILMFSLLIAVGWTSQVFAQSQEVPFTAEEAKNWTYDWVDAGGTTHYGADPTEKVTDANQMYYLLRHVYMDKRFPGPYYSAYTKNNVREREVYYGGMDGGWNIPGTALSGSVTNPVGDITIEFGGTSSNGGNSGGNFSFSSIVVKSGNTVLTSWDYSTWQNNVPTNWGFSSNQGSSVTTFNDDGNNSTCYISKGGTITIPSTLLQGATSVTVEITGHCDSGYTSNPATIYVNGSDGGYGSISSTQSLPYSWTVNGTTTTYGTPKAIGDITISGTNQNTVMTSIRVYSGSTTIFSWTYANDGTASSGSTGYWPVGMELDHWGTYNGVSAITFDTDLSPITLEGWMFTGYTDVTVEIKAYNPNSGYTGYLNVNGTTKNVTSTSSTTLTWPISQKTFNNAPVKYQADQYKPNKEGYTALIVKLKNNGYVKPSDATYSENSFYETPDSVISYLSRNVESIQLLTDGLVIGEGDQIGTVFNAPIDEYNKFFFLSKGQARQKSDLVEEMQIYNEHALGEQVPFRQMFEQFSPTSGKTGSQITDFYSEMMEGKVYRIVHDCLSVIQNGHQFSMSGNTGTTSYKMSGMNFFIPDYRLKYWETKDTLKVNGNTLGIYTVDGRIMNPVQKANSTGDPTYYKPDVYGNSKRSASDFIVWYAQYDTAQHAPLVGIYLINLEAEASQCDGYNEDNRFYNVDLDWTSSLNEMSGNGVSQTYIIYQVVTDSITGELVNVPIDTVENCSDFRPHLQLDTLYAQHAHSYTLTYVIEGSPTDSDHPGFITWSNTATVVIPGYDDFMVLNLHHYESDFVVSEEKNYYRNYMQPENDFGNGITRESILNGFDSFILYRTSIDGKVPVAKLKFAVDSNNKVRYKITYFDENEDYNTPNFNNNVLPSIINQLLNNQ